MKQPIRQLKFPFVFILLSFLVVFLLQSIVPWTFTKTDNLFSDLLFRLSCRVKEKKAPSPFLSLVVIDDPFIEEYGNNWQNQMLSTLNSKEAEYIALDYIFTKAEAFDTTLDHVFLPLYLNQVPDQNTGEPLYTFKQPWIERAPELPEMNKIFTSNKDLLPRLKGMGHVNRNILNTQEVYRLSTYLNYKGQYVPSLALAVTLDFLNVSQEKVIIRAGKNLELREALFPGGLKKDIVIPVNEKAEMIVNWTGPWEKRFSFIDPHWLMRERSAMEDDALNIFVHQSIVLVIDATTRGKDFITTPFSDHAPAGIALAHVIQSILEEDFYTPSSVWLSSLYHILLIILIPGFLLIPEKRVSLSLRWALLLIHPLLVIMSFLFLKSLLPFSAPWLALLISIICITLYESFKETKTTAISIINKVETRPQQENLEFFEKQCQAFKITQRQKEIIYWTHRGLESKEIAFKFNLSTKTVSNHLGRIYEKTGARNKLELVKIFFSG